MTHSYECIFPFPLLLIYRSLDQISPPGGDSVFWAGHLPRLDRKMCWVGRKLGLSVGLLGRHFLYRLFLVGVSGRISLWVLSVENVSPAFWERHPEVFDNVNRGAIQS